MSIIRIKLRDTGKSRGGKQDKFIAYWGAMLIILKFIMEGFSMRKSNKKGFTLVELVVVIAIIGVLAAILVPTMMNYVKKARLKTANANAKLIFTTCNNTASDLISDNISVTTLTHDGKVSDIEETDLGKAVKVALKDNGGETGYAKISFDPTKSDDEDTTDTDNFACWCASEDKLICGRYPNPPKKVADAKNCWEKG